MKTDKDASKVKSIGTRLGEWLAATIFMCGAALLVAVTIKIITWMFL